MTGATVFRRNGPAWRFEQQGNYLEHRTRTGSVYVILSDLCAGKPLWIGRVHGGAVYTVEKEIRAERIQFDNGDEYFFGGKPP